MSSDPIDFDVLVSPISDEQPAGVPLRDEESGFKRDFYEIRDGASIARKSERDLATYIPPPAGEEDPYKPEPPNWTAVLTKAEEILSTKSKDLWVVAWMIEALCRLQGFAGLRDGFRLAHLLCERYWGQLHPGGKEGDIIHLVSQLAGLNGVEGDGTLIEPIKAIPITSERGEGPFSYADYHAAARLEQEEDAERRQKRIDDGEVSLEQVEAAVAESSGEFYANLLATIDEAIDQFRQLNEVLEQCCTSEADGTLAPPSSSITNALQEVRHRVALFAGEENGATIGDESGEGLPADSTEPGAGQVLKVSAGQIASRADAFRLVLSIADFFEKTEPHSPVSYGLRQVVRWGRLTLPELLSQLIDHQDTRDQLFRHIGIEKPTDSQD